VQYGLDHTVIGEALVQTWGLSEEVALAVRHHHDMQRLEALDLPAESRLLIALSAAVSEALARSSGAGREQWPAECGAVAAVLGWTPQDLEARLAELQQ
jgi:HD-like signal output (HDOD) protein